MKRLKCQHFDSTEAAVGTPSQAPVPSRLPLLPQCRGENDNSDRMAYSHCSQSTRQPLCGSREASPSSRLLCGSSANVRRLLSSGKNKLESRPILRDVIQYYSKYNLSLAVAPNLGQNHNVPLFQKRLFRSRTVSAMSLFKKKKKNSSTFWKNVLSRVISPHPEVPLIWDSDAD